MVFFNQNNNMTTLPLAY